MNSILQVIGIVCLTIAVLLELASYYKQIAKTLRTKKSSQVSSMAFVYKWIKYVVTIIGLIIYANWVAVSIEVAAFIFCTIALYVVCRYKPKGWKLFK